MSKSPTTLPKMFHHKARNQARVTLRVDGKRKDVYLGTWGSPEADAEYRRILAEWVSTGGTVPAVAESSTLTVGQLVERWRAEFILSSPVEVWNKGRKPSMDRLVKLYGHTPAAELGPRQVKMVLDHCARERGDDGQSVLTRQYINAKVLQSIKLLVRWAVQDGLIPSASAEGVGAVFPLKRGYLDMRESDGVAIVDDAVVEATLAHLPPVVADMVRVQRLTGMRPGEVCRFRWCEVDRSGDVWTFSPKRHKTAHHGHTRDVCIGPKAQAVLMRYLDVDPGEYVFSPERSESMRKAAAADARRTPVGPAERRRRDAAQARDLRDAYTTDAYGLAVRRACQRGDLPHWHPNQLRHNAATAARAQFGLEAAGAVLGHSDLDVTKVYAERQTGLARDVAARCG